MALLCVPVNYRYPEKALRIPVFWWKRRQPCTSSVSSNMCWVRPPEYLYNQITLNKHIPVVWSPRQLFYSELSIRFAAPYTRSRKAYAAQVHYWLHEPCMNTVYRIAYILSSCNGYWKRNQQHYRCVRMQSEHSRINFYMIHLKIDWLYMIWHDGLQIEVAQYILENLVQQFRRLEIERK